MSDGGKGSKPRPFSVSQADYDENWNQIFGNKKIKNNDFQDILSTEDCVLTALENIKNER